MKTLQYLQKHLNKPISAGFIASLVFHTFIIFLFAQNLNIKQDHKVRNITLSMGSFVAQQEVKNTQSKHKHKNQKNIDKKVDKKIQTNKKSTNQEIQQVAQPIQDLQKVASPTMSTNAKNLDDTTLLEFDGKTDDEFLLKIKNIIDSNRAYPRLARLRRIQGEVLIEFILSKSGDLKDIKVLLSSGSAILDSDSLHTIKKAHRLFPLPPRSYKIRIPIMYSIG